MRTFKAATVALIVASFLFLVCAGSVVYSIHVRSDVQKSQAAALVQTCQQIELIKSAIRTVFERSQKTLVSNVYFKTHPKELEKARLQNKEYSDLFKAKEC